MINTVFREPNIKTLYVVSIFVFVLHFLWYA